MALFGAKILPGKLPDLLRQLGTKAPVAVKRGMISGAMRCRVVMQNKTAELKIFDRGTYRMRWKAEPTAKGARVFNDAPHAPVIEEGRRPGARPPPSAVIARWAQRKLHVPKKQAAGIGFVIARAIGKRGIPAKHVLGNMVGPLTAVVEEEVLREINRLLAGGP
jgi:hypothetical protein